MPASPTGCSSSADPDVPDREVLQNPPADPGQPHAMLLVAGLPRDRFQHVPKQANTVDATHDRGILTPALGDPPAEADEPIRGDPPGPLHRHPTIRLRP